MTIFFDSTPHAYDLRSNDQMRRKEGTGLVMSNKMTYRNEKRPVRGVFSSGLAEQEGFEPSIRHNRIPDFESGAFDHSAIAPVFELSILSQGRRTADAGVGAVPVGLMVMAATTRLKTPPSSNSTVADRSARVNTNRFFLPRTAATKFQP